MLLPLPYLPPDPLPESPALIRVVTRSEISWNRPAFPPPRLEVQPKELTLAEIQAATRALIRVRV